MRVAIYHGKNDGARSLKILADDLVKRIPNSYLANKMDQLKDADAILNIVLEDIGKIEETRRYLGYGRQVCFFASNVSEYTEYKLISYLCWLKTVPIVVHSPFHRDETLEALKVFNPSVQREYRRNLKYIPCGVTEEFVSTSTNNPEEWIVPFNRINAVQKNVGLHVETIHKFRNVRAMNGDSTPINKLYVMSDCLDFNEVGYETLPCPQDRMDYVRNAQKAGVFLCTSNFESFGLMYLELLACGVVGVFLDKPWIRKLLPNYKLIAPKDKLIGMLDSVYRDYATASRYVHQLVIPEIQQTYTFDGFVSGLINELENVYENSHRKD